MTQVREVLCDLLMIMTLKHNEERNIDLLACYCPFHGRQKLNEQVVIVEVCCDCRLKRGESDFILLIVSDAEHQY